MQNKATKIIKKEDKKDRIAAILMLSPVVILLLVCSIYPFLWMFRYVCYDYNGFTATFTGARNFTRMIHDTTFWTSVGHTFEYALYKLVFIIPLALVCAVLLNQKIKGTSVFRAVYFRYDLHLHLCYTEWYSQRNPHGVGNGCSCSVAYQP